MLTVDDIAGHLLEGDQADESSFEPDDRLQPDEWLQSDDRLQTEDRWHPDGG
jgi:hypothetical protein